MAGQTTLINKTYDYSAPPPMGTPEHADWLVHWHFEFENPQQIDMLGELYTDDIVWELPSAGIEFRGKRDVIENYRKTFFRPRPHDVRVSPHRPLRDCNAGLRRSGGHLRRLRPRLVPDAGPEHQGGRTGADAFDPQFPHPERPDLAGERLPDHRCREPLTTGGCRRCEPQPRRRHSVKSTFRSHRAYGGPQRVSLTTKAAAAAAMRVTASASTACGQRSSGRWNSGLLPTKVT